MKVPSTKEKVEEQELEIQIQKNHEVKNDYWKAI
jgi:hypothetical protein